MQDCCEAVAEQCIGIDAAEEICITTLYRLKVFEFNAEDNQVKKGLMVKSNRLSTHSPERIPAPTPHILPTLLPPTPLRL